jgi:ParB family chromosome partitioning protein
MSVQKKALGRGLDALLDSSNYQKSSSNNELEQKPVTGGIAEIPLHQIKANQDQPRKEFDYEKLDQLAESIKKLGIIQPITVRKISRDRYELISGERRFRAAQLLHFESIPAYVREADNVQSLEMALVENIQRQDLNPLEIALSYHHLVTDCQISVEELSAKMGKNKSTVINFLRLLKLPDHIQIGLRENKLSMGHARALINIESEQEQLLVYEDILKKNLSVRQVEDLVRKLHDKSVKKESKTSLSLPFKYEQFKTKLVKQFGKHIDIKRSSKGTGSIEFNFTSDDELDSIIEQLLKSSHQ